MCKPVKDVFVVFDKRYGVGKIIKICYKALKNVGLFKILTRSHNNNSRVFWFIGAVKECVRLCIMFVKIAKNHCSTHFINSNSEKKIQ